MLKKQKQRKRVDIRGQRNILWLKEISIKDIPLVGGKNASLGEMYNTLTKKGIKIPNGFTVTAKAYWRFLDSAGLRGKMKKALQNLNIHDVKQLRRVGKKIRSMILKAKFPEEIEKEIVSAYKNLKKGKRDFAVAVRSSATAEDLPGASFAGQQETYLNVKGEKELLAAVKKCIASLFTARAMSYRESQGFEHMQVALSVAVQEMVNASAGSAGVMFTLDTESGFQGVTLINSSYGLGEYVVKGRVVPDQFYIFKQGLKKGKKAIISRRLGTKEVKLVYGKQKGTKQEKVLIKYKNQFSLTDKDVLELAKWGSIIENHYKKPQDIEWVKDGKTGQLFIVQSRPETVKARDKNLIIEKYHLKKEGKQLLTGSAIGQKIGVGPVQIIQSPKELSKFKKGDVLVTRLTDPDWEPIMRIASAIITEQGGKTSHAAIVSRELGVPCIVGAHKARKVLKQGQKVTVCCTKGDEGIVYKGILPFEVKKTVLKNVPKTKTKIMMNVGDPEHAFSLSFLPHEGVGLARLEFIFSDFIRIHPLALLHYKRLKDKQAKKKIREMTYGYKNKSDYCVERLAEGIARIAAAMYPHDAVVRLSDFKTNEYATLIGGKEFEPKEENPMLGWRGASRYYSKQYKQAFGLECKALKKVREEWGLKNVIAMVPFCRTPEEGKKVLQTMESFGLRRNKNGLKVYVMCEIPSNVILAKDFAKIFDGFSIGSNDLTQLTLGVDRDSALVSHVYDENSLAVKNLIKSVIKIAHKHKRKVGICGQAPSDYPKFAEFLVRSGIDSVSLNPDTVVETRKNIAKLEKTIGKTGNRTNKKLLGLVAIFAFICAGAVGLGAGCGLPQDGFILSPSQRDYISPADIRQRAVEKALEDNEKKMAVLTVNDFANFEIEYPRGWNIEYWNGGVTISDPESEEYINIFKQVLGHSVLPESKKEIEIDGIRAVRFIDNAPKDGKEFGVVEIELGRDILEINGDTERFDEILDTIRFGDDLGEKMWE